MFYLSFTPFSSISNFVFSMSVVLVSLSDTGGSFRLLKLADKIPFKLFFFSKKTHKSFKQTKFIFSSDILHFSKKRLNKKQSLIISKMGKKTSSSN